MAKKNIIYNGENIFTGQATPFFSKNVEYVQVGERWCQAENWTLNGLLTGCNFDELEASRTGLLGKLSSAYGSLNIADEFNLPIVEVTDISIDSSDYIGALPYSISFLNYPSGSFSGENHSGFFGVIDPSDSISYTENTDGIMEMTRQISAKGILTDAQDKDSALDNVKAFINYRKDKIARPFLIKNDKTNSSYMDYYLVSSEESYNRITNEGSMSQTFRTDLTDVEGAIIHRYTYDQQDNVGEPIIRTYNGQIDAGRYGSITGARSKYNTFKNSLVKLFLIDEEVSEDLYINRITYRFSFYEDVDTNDFPEIKDDFSITLSEDSSSSLFNASIRGNLSVNYGCLEGRSQKILDYHSSVKNLNYHFDIINLLYKNFYKTSAGSKQNRPQNIALNPLLISKSQDFDEFNKTLSYNARFDDRYIPPTFAQCVNCNVSVNFEYGVSLKSIKEYYLGGKYICQDLGTISRETIGGSVDRDGSISFVGRDVCQEYILGILQSLRHNSATEVYLDSPSYSKSEDNKTESFSVSQNYNTTEGVSVND